MLTVSAAGDQPGQPQRRQHGGEGVAGHAGHGEQAGDPLGVAEGQLEHGVDAHRPAHDRRLVDAEVVHHRQRVLDEVPRSRSARGPRAGRSRRCRGGSTTRCGRRSRGGAAPARSRGWCRARCTAPRSGPSMRPVGVVGPGGQAGPVVGEHVAVGDARRGGDAGRGGRHASIVPEPGSAAGSDVPMRSTGVSAAAATGSCGSRVRGVRAAKNASTSSRSARRAASAVLAIIALRRAPCWDSTDQVRTRSRTRDGSEDRG